MKHTTSPLLPGLRHSSPAFPEQSSPAQSSHGRRSGWTGVWFALIAMSSVSGCMNAQNTRFPTWNAWSSSAENQAYERQDPFPDPDLGPSLDSTPRGYERPRSSARRAAEQRLFQGVPVGPESVPPGVPQGGLNSGRAVY